jgi:hypothetical protein
MRIKVFTNDGRNVRFAESDANRWLREMGDSIEVISVDTTASAVEGGGFASEMFYITIVYREKHKE